MVLLFLFVCWLLFAGLVDVGMLGCLLLCFGLCVVLSVCWLNFDCCDYVGWFTCTYLVVSICCV